MGRVAPPFECRARGSRNVAVLCCHGVKLPGPKGRGRGDLAEGKREVGFTGVGMYARFEAITDLRPGARAARGKDGTHLRGAGTS